MIPAILVAAGESKRMGLQNKLLLPLGKSTLIKEVVKTYCRIGFTEVMVVVGHDWERIIEELRGLSVTMVYNRDFQTGMTSSIHKGLQHMVSGTGFLLGTTDTPGINPEHLSSLLRMYKESYHRGLILRSCAGNHISHPTIFTSAYKSVLQDCQEPDGCKSVILKYQQHWQLVETSKSVLVDIDTESAFIQWNKENEQ